MSLMCPMQKCKEQKGPCKCEKAMGLILAAAALFGLYKKFGA